MGKIAKISSYEVIQSSGRSTIGAEMLLDDGKIVKTSVASDEKIATYQTQELEASKSVYYINDLIGPKLKGVDTGKQAEVDAWLLAVDKTPTKEKLGVNTVWAISSLLAKAQAKSTGVSLFRYLNSLYNKRYSVDQIPLEKPPTPIVPILRRGSKIASFDFKEFCLVPSSSLSFSKSTQLAISFYHAVKKVIGENHPGTNFDVFEILLSAMSNLNLKLAIDVFIGLNFGANNYYQSGTYEIKDKPQPLKTDIYLEYISTLVKKYFPLFLIDPLSVDDLASWRILNSALSKETYLVGGDLVASSAERLKKVSEEKNCSSILLKPAQVGTVTEFFDMVSSANKNDLDYIVASSDYETGEAITADLAVSVAADFVKFGTPVHEEEIAKYNRMLEIERELNKT